MNKTITENMFMYMVILESNNDRSILTVSLFEPSREYLDVLADPEQTPNKPQKQIKGLVLITFCQIGSGTVSVNV